MFWVRVRWLRANPGEKLALRPRPSPSPNPSASSAAELQGLSLRSAYTASELSFSIFSCASLRT